MDVRYTVLIRFPIIAQRSKALLQHGIQVLIPLKIVPPYTVSSATSCLTS